MRVVIAGSSGLIGTALVSSLRGDGHDVVRLVRRSSAGPDESRWDPQKDRIDTGILADADAVVNLCGVGVGDKRWTGAYKQLIRDSRIAATDVLAEGVAEAAVPVFVNASAVGYYGDTGDRIVDETSPSGTGFLADTCRDWETATAPADTSKIRTVLLRSGIVLSPRRPARQAEDAVLVRARRPARQRPPVPVVDLAGGRGRCDQVRPHPRRRRRSRERHRPGARHQRPVERRCRADAAPPRALDRSRVRGQRAGRRVCAGRHSGRTARDTHGARECGFPLPAQHHRGSARRRPRAVNPGRAGAAAAPA